MFNFRNDSQPKKDISNISKRKRQSPTTKGSGPKKKCLDSSESQDTSYNINSLNNEILFHIFSYFDGLTRLRLLKRYFYTVCIVCHFMSFISAHGELFSQYFCFIMQNSIFVPSIIYIISLLSEYAGDGETW